MSCKYIYFSQFNPSIPFSFSFFSLVITGLRFGTGVLQENFVAELETHYDNYIL